MFEWLETNFRAFDFSANLFSDLPPRGPLDPQKCQKLNNFPSQCPIELNEM